MAVKSAQRHTDGDREVVFFSDLAGEVDEKGSLIVFRITELLDPERGQLGSWHGPLVGDILVVDSGERPELNGKVLRGIEVRFAPTWTLRGQARPGDDVKRVRDIPDGDNEVGDDVIGRVRKLRRSGKEFVAVDEPTAAEHKQALKAMKDAGGDDWPTKGEPARSSDAAKAADDSEPPF